MTTDALLRHSPALATSTTLQARLNSAAGKTAPLMRHAAIASLVQFLGERLSTAESVRQHHGRDASYHPCAPPDAVAFAQSTEEVSQIVKVCAHYKVPIIPFGSGTGLEGHVLALQGGVTIDLSLMNKILQVNSGDLDATVEAGVTHGELNKQLRDNGLFFSVDPGANATLGGMAATRASGTTAVRYGTMRENVLSLKVVLPDGRIIRTSRRARKSSAGYDLTRLFVGSKGTLGVFTEVTVRLQPIPVAISVAMCSFPTVGAAVSTVTQTIQAGIPVARMELADAVRMEAIIRYSKLDLPLAPVLWMEFHGTEDSVAEQAKMVQTIAGAYGGNNFSWATNPKDRAKLWQARHDAYYAWKATRPGVEAWVTDVCVPISQLTACITETQNDLASSFLKAGILGHAGDGNFHVGFYLLPNEPKEIAEAQRLNERLVHRALALDGTCSGEHGIGCGKIDFLVAEHGETTAVMRTIKKAIDPDNIMNPGKIFRDCRTPNRHPPVDLSAQTFLKGYDRNRLRRGSLSTSGDGPLLFREAGHTIKDYFVYDTKGSLYPNIPFVVSGAVARRQTRAHDSDVRHRNWRRHNCGQSSLNPCWGLPRCVFAVRPRRTNDRQMMALGAAGGGKGMRPVLVDSWLESKFEDGKSAAKVDPIKRSRANLRADTSNSAFVQRNTYAKHL